MIFANHDGGHLTIVTSVKLHSKRDPIPPPRGVNSNVLSDDWNFEVITFYVITIGVAFEHLQEKTIVNKRDNSV